MGRKILGIVKLILFGILTTPFTLYSFFVKSNKGDDQLQGARVIKGWCKTVIPMMGFKIRRSGKLPEGGPFLYVCNHRSSLDPLILMTDVLAYPVSKAAVSGYPIVGKGALNVGVIFVDKENRSSRAATKVAIHEALKKGKSVLIFPEGRTHAEPLTTTFLKGAFEQAADLNVPVVPMAMDYKYKEDFWDHSITMVQHYFRYLAKWRTPVSIRYGEPIQSDNSFALLRQSQAWVNEQIAEMREEW